MAQKVDNLRVNNTEVKHIYIKLTKDSDWQELKEFFFNNTLIWKNANAFIFVNKLTDEVKKDILSQLGEDTIIFEGFGNEFTGSYILVQNAEQDKPDKTGQMAVETTEGDE
jgi:hypothetical protein